MLGILAVVLDPSSSLELGRLSALRRQDYSDFGDQKALRRSENLEKNCQEKKFFEKRYLKERDSLG